MSVLAHTSSASACPARTRRVRVFRAAKGGPLRYATFRTRVWQPAVKSVGLADVTFHDLRRTSATALLNVGVDVKTAQHRLGHSDPRMTLGVYAKATTEADRAAAEAVGDLFLGSASDDTGQPQTDRSRGENAGTASDEPAVENEKTAGELRKLWSPRSDSNRRPAVYKAEEGGYPQMGLD